jgi:hypothetical protein
MNCEHFFIPKEKKETASCLGTHTTRCQHCDLDYIRYICDVTEHDTIRYFQECSEILEKMENGGEYDKTHPCLIKDPIEKDIAIKKRSTHIHVWDEMENGDYKCIASVYDWNKSKPYEHLYVSVACKKRLSEL